MNRAEAVLIGSSAVIRRLRRTIERIAPASIPVLIEGPTGSGKELVALLLHELSTRRGAFVAFNVCAIGDSMFEDALFGHVRGAYTGAAFDSAGFLREAHGGTLFLDEIGGLPAAPQAKLLRALETGVFRPIGSARDTRSDFRVISATNEGIATLVETGRFRADLAHRMSGIVLTVPSLAERRGDIPALASHFARGRLLEPDAANLLANRAWPGNVRELKQVIDAATVFARGALDTDAVRLALAHRSRGSLSTVPPYSSRRHLTAMLEAASWNTATVARQLNVHRSTLYRRLKRLGVPLRGDV